MVPGAHPSLALFEAAPSQPEASVKERFRTFWLHSASLTLRVRISGAFRSPGGGKFGKGATSKLALYRTIPRLAVPIPSALRVSGFVSRAAAYRSETKPSSLTRADVVETARPALGLA